MKATVIKQSLERWLVSEVADRELQERCEKFKRERDSLNGIMEKLTPEVDSLKFEFDNNNAIILNLLLSNIEVPRKLVENNQSLRENMGMKQRALSDAIQMHEKAEERLEGLKNATETKLYHYWSIMKAATLISEPWMEWKRQFEGKIF